VLMGCAMDSPGFIYDSTLEGVGITAKVFSEHIPTFGRAAVDKAWACMMPTTPDSLPYIGKHPALEGLVIAAGHSFGNAAGTITGKMVAGIIGDRDPGFVLEPFNVSRHPGIEIESLSHWA
jgi:glycine/D-amino acid oxidase-like deaminating enzyme